MVDMADRFYRGKERASDVHRKFNKCVTGRVIVQNGFFCYNLINHTNGQKVIKDYPGKCPECGRELEEGESRVPL